MADHRIRKVIALESYHPSIYITLSLTLAVNVQMRCDWRTRVRVKQSRSIKQISNLHRQDISYGLHECPIMVELQLAKPANRNKD